MNKKLLNILLLVTFHLGYLEWGKDQSLFIFQAEQEIFSKATTDFKNVLHPLILIPSIGLMLLLITLFQSNPGRKLTLTGLACLSIFMVLLFFIGLLGLNFKILLSTIPFIITGSIIIFNKRGVAE